MKARDFDQKFDAGADVSGDVDWGKARRPIWSPSGLTSTSRHGSSKRSTVKPAAWA